jgi:hypothetical protein
MAMTADRLGQGIIAGFLATVALSVLFDPIALAARAAGVTSPPVACLAHFVVGSLLWGALYSVLDEHLWGPPWLRGLVFGVVAWAVAVLVVLSLRREGFTAIDVALVRSAPMLVLHMIYGALLGGIYVALAPADGRLRRDGACPPHAEESHRHDLRPLAR